MLTVAAGSYAGVGSGIALAGLLVLAVGQLGESSTAAWVALGALAAVLAAALLLRPKGHRRDDAGHRTDAPATARNDGPRGRGSRRPGQKS
jgi:Uncharacterised MFS-type transporter YbfB